MANGSGRVIGGALLTAAVVLSFAPAASAAPDSRSGFTMVGSTSLTGEALALRTTDAYAGCAAGATSYSFPLTGAASGPVAGTYTATVTSTVTDGTRTTTIAFDIAGGSVTGTQVLSAPADARGACAPLADGMTSTWTASVGNATDDGTALISAGPDGTLVDSLSSTPAPSASPSPTQSPSPSDPPSPTATPSASASASATASASPTATQSPTTQPTTQPTTLPIDPDISFQYQVEPGRPPTGSCTVTGGSTADPVTIDCLDVTRYQRTGNKVSFTGHATQNDLPTTYTIKVVDGAGSDPDSFTIETGTGYLGGGSLVAGSLSVR